MEKAILSSNQFNLKLLLAYRDAMQEGNIFYSPISIVSALMMLSGGAQANTKKEMESVLGIEDPDSVHQGLRDLSKSIFELPNEAILNIVNIIAVDKSYEILPEFSSNLKQNYNAEPRLVDFQHSAEASRKILNQLIEEATHEKIKDLFPPNAISSDTKLILANAIYFKGMWNEPFDKNRTKKMPFYTHSNQEIMVDMMYAEDSFRYFYSEALKASFLELPYKGGKITMMLILPEKKNGLSLLEKNITVDEINSATIKMSKKKVHLLLPRFKLEESLPLNNCLSDMGMKEAFADSADFSGISGKKDLFVSAALHKAFVEVNEEGTEAAAATGFIIIPCSRIVHRPISFMVDHPFMLFIRETDSGLILFTGSVHNL